MAEEMRGVPIGELPDLQSIPEDSLLVAEFLDKAYKVPGDVLRQLIQDIFTALGGSIDDVTEARMTAAIETVLATGKYNGVSPIVEVTTDENGKSVLHVVDAFGAKDYPVEVQGATDAVRYVEQDLTEPQKEQARANIGASQAVSVEISQTLGTAHADVSYSVLLNGEPVTGNTLDEMYRSGTPILGFLKGHFRLYKNDWRSNLSISNVVFHYDSAVVYAEGFTDVYEFRVQTEGCYVALAYQDGKWTSNSIPVYPTIMLSADALNGAPRLIYNGRTYTEDYYDIVSLSTSIRNRMRLDAPVFCYQSNMQFPLQDGSGTVIAPPLNTPFSVRFTEDSKMRFYAEQDGYRYTVIADSENGYIVTAEKTAVYKTAESKADNLQTDEETNTISLLSGGEPIGTPVKLPAGGATDAVRYVEQELTDEQKAQARENLGITSPGPMVVALSGNYEDGYTVLLDGEAVTGDALDALVQSGNAVIGIAESNMTFWLSTGLIYTVPKGTIFQYSNAVVFFENRVHHLEFRAQLEDNDFALFYKDEEWMGQGQSEHISFQLVYSVSSDSGVIVRYNGASISAADLNKLLFNSLNRARPIFCYQENARFYTEEGEVVYPSYYTPFYFNVDASGDYEFTCEFDGYKCTLHVLSEGYSATAEKIESGGSPDAVQYVPQDLTDTQKAQARSNIGAEVAGTAENLPAVKYEAQTLTDEQKAQARTNIDAIAANGEEDRPTYNGEDLALLSDLGNGDGPLLVTASGNDTEGYTIDHTFDDILAAHNSGRSVLLKYGAAICDLTAVYGQTTIHFSCVEARGSSGAVAIMFNVDLNNNVTKTQATLDTATALLYEAQTLTDTQKAQARSNIGAAAATDLSGYLPLRGGLMTGPLSFKDSTALPQKTSPAFLLAVDDLNTGGQVGWTRVSSLLSNYVTTNTTQTITGAKTFNAPANVAGTEQHTVKFKTSNGGALIIGKEAANSGTMLRFDQVDGTTRLKFRGSATPGAMVWEQPEQGAQLYVDLGKEGVDKHRISFPASAGTLALTSGTVANATAAGRASQIRSPYYGSQIANGNLAVVGDDSVTKFLSTSNMTTGRPTFGDAHILHFEWDNTSGYSSQIAVNNSSGQLEVRGMSNGTWQEWRRILDSKNFASYITPSAIGALPLSGGTMTGDLTVGSAKVQANGYVKGTWLQTTANNATTSKVDQVCVQSNGWIYTRTLAEILSDIGALSTGGGTISGKLIATGGIDIRGSAASQPLKVRGIVGSDGSGTVAELYLQYGASKALMLGNTGAYNISADGSTYSGTAARATADGNGNNIANTYAKKTDVVEITGGKLIVTVTGNDTSGYTIDSTFDKMLTAYNAGRDVWLKQGAAICRVGAVYGTNSMNFSYVEARGDNTIMAIRFVVDLNNNVTRIASTGKLS